MAQLRYVNRPQNKTFWILPDLVLAGPETVLPRGWENHIILQDLERDSVLIETIQILLVNVENRVPVYVAGNQTDLFVVAACFFNAYNSWPWEECADYVAQVSRGAISNLEDPDRIEQIKRYRRPLLALFCGDRNSPMLFEEVVWFELEALPKYSVVMHGGCKGIDTLVEEFAQSLKIKTKVFKAQWDLYGSRAGPIRNAAMVNARPDVVYAFHPDIELSKGTRNVMEQAYRKGIPVYLHNQKRKVKFEGVFTDAF